MTITIEDIKELHDMFVAKHEKEELEAKRRWAVIIEESAPEHEREKMERPLADLVTKYTEFFVGENYFPKDTQLPDWITCTNLVEDDKVIITDLKATTMYRGGGSDVYPITPLSSYGIEAKS
jgi:hypothetical protein